MNNTVKAGKAKKLPLKSRKKLGSASLYCGHNHCVHQLQLPEHLQVGHEIKLKYSDKLIHLCQNKNLNCCQYSM
jgi:hypothetical protein